MESSDTFRRTHAQAQPPRSRRESQAQRQKKTPVWMSPRIPIENPNFRKRQANVHVLINYYYVLILPECRWRGVVHF